MVFIYKSTIFYMSYNVCLTTLNVGKQKTSNKVTKREG